MKASWIISALVAVANLAAGCAIEPGLHLKKAVKTEVLLVTEVNVDMVWQINWKATWDFNWDVQVLGTLGYQLPASMCLHIYGLNSEGELYNHSEHNFVGTSSFVDVPVGVYNLLFYNNDSEALLFTSADDLADIFCYTRTISTGLKDSEPIYTPQQKAAGLTKADDLSSEPVSLPPEGLFSMYDQNFFITDDPKDLVFEDGRYILKVEGELDPSTYIYLIQVKLLNNNGRVVGSAGGGAITGMAGGVNLMSREALENTVSVPMDVYMDRDQDMLGAKVFSFGLPGCNAYDKASVKAAPEHTHYLVLNISYSNGTYRNIRADITDQVRALPTGGVITLELDVEDFPPIEGGGEETGGGFSALIDDWDEETGSYSIR